MDVYSPNGTGPFPAIIYIHGGGWVEGNRSDFSSIAELYALRGIAGFSISYTLAAENRSAWPQNVEDVISALTYIRENAALFHIDTGRIAVMGSSAGAHLASLVGTLTGNEPFLTNRTLAMPLYSQVCLVINYDGVEDLEFVGQNSTENLALLNNIVSSQFGGVTYGENSTLWREASPVTYISATDPLFVFVHGTEDRIVPIQVAESFNTNLEAAGVETQFIQIQGDHDILTNEAMNLQARYLLEPILKSFFEL
jgi:acetyl esterase/lipase